MQHIFPGADPSIYGIATDPEATPVQIASVALALTRLAEQAHGGDAGAWTTYHATVYGLHEHRDPVTLAARTYVTEQAHRVDDHYAPLVEHDQALSPDEFREHAMAVGGPAQRSAHPMSVHLFDGPPSAPDLAIYMRHHWHRTKRFYTLFGEFGRRLPLSDVAPIYGNLFDETGCESPEATPHPTMLQRLLQHMGVPCDLDDHSELTSGQAYLNNRVRCMRSRQPEWGWGMLFSLECIVHGVHGKILRQLRQLGLDEDMCEFHRLHSELDADHAAELLDIIVDRVRTAQQQRIFFSSIALHQQRGQRYFDAIWTQIQQQHRRTVPQRAAI